MIRYEIAKELCRADGYDPYTLEPGDLPVIDGYRNGEPCHYLWRQWVEKADRILALPVEGWTIYDDAVSFTSERPATLQEVIGGKVRKA